MSDDAAADDTAEPEPVDTVAPRVSAEPAGVLPPPALLLMAFCLVAFVCLAAAGVLFADLPVVVRCAAVAAASLIVMGLVAAAVGRSAGVLALAAVLVGLACAAASFAATSAQQRQAHLRTQYVAGRAGPVVTLLSGSQTSQLARHMLAGVAGWVAAITAGPLAAYFGFRAFRAPPRRGGTPHTPAA